MGEYLGQPYQDILLRGILDVVTVYFSENSVGSDGFSKIDIDQTYSLPDLFEQRYGSGASTAS